MSAQGLTYQLPPEWEFEQLLSALESGVRLRAEPLQREVWNYFDSFDWRLYRGQGVLRQVRQGRDVSLLWCDRTSSTVRETLRLDGQPMPVFAWDLPNGLMRSLLAPLLEMRALLPRLELKIQSRTIRMLNGDGKTVARMRFSHCQARVPGSAARAALPPRLQLIPLRGYQRSLRKLQNFIDQQLQLPPVEKGLLECGLEALGRQVNDYSSKLELRLDPKMPASRACRQIYRTLLDTLEANIAGAKADTDSEFLHDLRVAVRRTRSLQGLAKAAFDTQTMEPFREGFRWIGEITGATRDLDVYLLDYPAYRDSLPEVFRPDMEPLHRFLQSHQAKEHRALVRKLNSPYFRGLLKQWREFIESDGDDEEAGLSIGELAQQRIAKLSGQILRDGRAIHPTSPAEALHELRKRCKKFRYALEFFQSFYPPKRVKPMIRLLKRLLDNLGAFQDLEVQALRLREFAHQMVKEQETPADTLLAMGMLVDGLLQRQQQARDEFAALFAAYDAAPERQAFEKLLPQKEKKQ